MLTPSIPIARTLIYSLGFHAGLNGKPESDNLYPAGSSEAEIWLYAWRLGAAEKNDLDVEQDIDGIGALFEPRD
jgi:hypothetical protein